MVLYARDGHTVCGADRIEATSTSSRSRCTRTARVAVAADYRAVTRMVSAVGSVASGMSMPAATPLVR